MEIIENSFRKAIHKEVYRKMLVVASQLCLKFGANIKEMG